MEITFLGTGGAVATPERDNTAILLEYNGRKILIDCPGSIVSKLGRTGIDFKKIDAVFITHFHPDHVYGLPSLLHSLKPSGKRPALFVPEKIRDKTRSLLEIFGLSETTEVIPVKDKIKELNMTLFKTAHTPGSSGIKVTGETGIFIYSSDTGPVNNCSALFKDADCLVHDCSGPASLKLDFPELDITHTSAFKLGEIAAAANVKKLFPVHFSGEYDFSMETILSEIRKNYGGTVVIPEDLKSYRV